MKRITGDYLIKRGWEKKGGVYVLRSSIRFGWNEDTKELIAGYTLLPFPVEYVQELATILAALRVDFDDSERKQPIGIRARAVIQAAQEAVGKKMAKTRRAEDVLIRMFASDRLRREGYSYEEIGRVLGRDHATIIHYVGKKMSDILALPNIYRDEIKMYNKMNELLNS